MDTFPYKNVNPCFQYKNNNRICKTEILSDKEKVNLIYASEVAMFNYFCESLQQYQHTVNMKVVEKAL